MTESPTPRGSTISIKQLDERMNAILKRMREATAHDNVQRARLAELNKESNELIRHAQSLHRRNEEQV